MGCEWLVENKYIGKTCPYCKTKITAEDTFAVCSICDMPHHLACWQENCGCTTFGCTGCIEEILGKNSEEAVLSEIYDPAPAVNSYPQPVPSPYPTAPQNMYTPAPQPAVNAYAPAPAPQSAVNAYAPAPAPQPAVNAYAPAPAQQPAVNAYAPVPAQQPAVNTYAPASAQPWNTSEKRASVNQSRREKKTESLYESKELIFLKNIPLVIENLALVIDRAEDKVYARCVFRCLEEKEINAALVEIRCSDVWGTEFGESITYQYLDLNTARGTRFGQNSYIGIPDNTTRKISVSVKKVLFADGSVAEDGEKDFVIPAPTLLKDKLSNEGLFAEYKRETTSNAKFVPDEAGSYWLCTCGALNRTDEEKCHYCTCAKEQLISSLDEAGLQERLNSYKQEKMAADEKEKAEREERMRVAEEQLEDEKARKELEEMQEKQSRRQKNIFKKSVISIIVAIVLLVAGSLVYEKLIQPYQSYQSACDALANKDYDYAYSTFVSLGDYKDSQEMATKTRYENAEDLLSEKEYESAYNMFMELDGYKDSEERITDCIYGWADKALNDGTEAAAENFSENVDLKKEHYETVYNKICTKIARNPKYDFWDYNQSQNALIMLNTLPSSYSGVATLTLLFEDWDGNARMPFDSDYIRDNEQNLRYFWTIDFVKDYLLSDTAISRFLEGYWETYNGEYYISFYENEDGGTSSRYNLPWVSEPSGTKYYYIEDRVYYYGNENNHRLAKVYRFEIVDFDTMRVYCFKNNRTYTVYR